MPTDLLPKWYKTMKLVAINLSVGFYVAYLVVNKVVDLSPNVKELVNLGIVILWVPSIVLAGLGLLDYIKLIKRDV